MYGEEAVKETKQIALGNTTGLVGWSIFDDEGCYLLQCWNWASFFPQQKGDKMCKHTRKMCFRLTWCLTPPCIEILFFNKTMQEFTQPDICTLNSFLSKATSKFCRTLIQSNICQWDYLQRRLD
ncbi:hypothetical protein ElyMa_006888100 [Elysia marginata]|uniref:Uncharacterized protein n=1 Tax=Elysia marginata TaxID=1093978 RepID=A0AAV4JEX5_9GAST|nr:hypothetical protein ElyMa_006888100 [Elysia marginata]